MAPADRGQLYLVGVNCRAGRDPAGECQPSGVFFLGIELISLPLFGLVGYAFHQKRSLEASIKYTIPSAAASSFLLFGMALVYAQSGDLSFVALGKNLGKVCSTSHCTGQATDDCWPRLQTLSGAVPPVDARRLPGRACAEFHFGDGEPIVIFGVVMRLFPLRTGR